MTRDIADQLKNFGITNKKIQQFDVYTVLDEIIDFPEVRVGQKRQKHEKRLVIILQNNKDNEAPLIKVVLIAPLSTSKEHHRLDYLLHKSKHQFLKEDSYIRLRYSQPILKVDLKKKCGTIDQLELRENIKDRLFNLFDF